MTTRRKFLDEFVFRATSQIPDKLRAEAKKITFVWIRGKNLDPFFFFNLIHKFTDLTEYFFIRYNINKLISAKNKKIEK